MAILQFPKKEPFMVKAKLKEILLKNGIESASMDEIVHNEASQQASSANNEGIDGQINFLMEHGWTPQNIINALEIQA
jgi:hypothetical protein